MRDSLSQTFWDWNRECRLYVGPICRLEAKKPVSLVDEITYKQAAASASSATPSAILGPFWRHDAPIRKNGESIVIKVPSDGKIAYMFGRITDGNTDKPLSNACVDVWQASTNGKMTTL